MKCGCLVLLAGVAACAGAPLASSNVPVMVVPSPPGLPGFGGRFAGTLRIHGERLREVPMGLDVLPSADGVGWSWRLRYGEGEAADVRDYRLLVDDASNGRYRIDEQNGIVLHARAVGDELVSVFTVSGQTLCVRYRAVPDGIEFALESFDGSRSEATGQGVTTVAAMAAQRALLRRLVGAP